MHPHLENEYALKMLRASERRLANTISTFHRELDYTVMRSAAFPTFYAGNALLIHDPHDSCAMDSWIAEFRRFFPSDQYHHITLMFPSITNATMILEAGSRKGFKTFTEVLMAAPVSKLVETASVGIPHPSIRTLSNVADELLLFRLHLADAIGEDWFVDEEDFRKLFRKTMTTSKGVGVEWIAATLGARTDEVDSALGFFDEDRLCRLQEVMTAPKARGNGLASLLIREVAIQAQQRGVRLIGLFAEENSKGYRLYRKLGFESLDRDVILMQY